MRANVNRHNFYVLCLFIVKIIGGKKRRFGFICHWAVVNSALNIFFFFMLRTLLRENTTLNSFYLNCVWENA